MAEATSTQQDARTSLEPVEIRHKGRIRDLKPKTKIQFRQGDGIHNLRYFGIMPGTDPAEAWFFHRTSETCFEAACYRVHEDDDGKYIDFNGAKLREQENDFDRSLLQRFIQIFCVNNAPSIELVGDDTGGWDKCRNYEEVLLHPQVLK